jgi:hypothetical protein
MQKEIPKANQKKSASKFCAKVLAAAKKAEFTPTEIRKLERIVTEAEERDEILAQGVSTVLDLSGIPPDDVDELCTIMRKAHENVNAGKEPFTKESLQKLERILSGKVSAGALARIQKNLSKNETLICALKETLEEKSERMKKLKSTPRKR